MTLDLLPGKAIIKFLSAHQFRIRALNLVYLIGASAEDWTPISNTMDQWNDVRLVVRNTGEVLLSNQATSDPGRYYEQNPLNDAGCAILALGQHKDAWEMGYMHDTYPALIQCADLVIYRDRAQDGGRYGHTCIADPSCGIMHHGCNGTDGTESVGRWSAGCQVGRYWNSHMKFIQMMRDSGNKTFDATLIDRVTLTPYI